MPSLQQRQQARTEELFEFPITGPFGGVQSELPPTEIENYGFQDATNVIFRRGAASVRPGFTALTPIPGIQEPIIGVVDFFNNLTTRIACVMTPTRLLRWNGSPANDWTEITGPGFTGGPTQLWSWDVVGQKLCFSQGADPIWIWDGVSGSYVSADPVNAPPANYLAEIGLHLMAADTIEGGTRHSQRYHWSGAGDPTDWTSFNSGLNDNLNNLGPINGLKKLGQYGFGFHQLGIVQIIPTGIGTDPFDFVPIVNCSLGNICPHSLDHFNIGGIEQAAFAGEDNIYIFNQSSLIPIGDQPIDGRKRLGARSRIYADIFAGNPRQVFGYVTTSINGNPFNAYWLIIPGISVWVYNFDEGNWTRFTYQNQIDTMGNFYTFSVIRIEDLIGPILAQNWTPATLAPTNPFQGMALGFDNGVVGYVDFSNFSEQPWRIIGPKHTFGDARHKHSLKKFRIRILDQGSAMYTVVVTNESGYSQTQSVTLGNGSGDVLSAVLPFSVSGIRLQWTISGIAEPSAIVELCPIFDISGEQRGGTADSN